jgi:hypothetical protein
MFKKIMLFLALLSLGAGFLSACKPDTDITSGVSPTDMISFLNKRAKARSSLPGWVHVTENIVYNIDKENLGVLPDGTVIPLEQVNETWYHINTDGLVYQYVSIMKTTDGAEVQVSLFLNNQIVNLKTAEITPVQPYSLGGLDYLFSIEMQNFIDSTGGEPSLRITDLDGKQIVIFTIEEQLDSPATTESYTEPVYAARTVAWYEYDTGLLFRLERYRIFKDGSERLFFQTDITVEPVSLPPEEVQAYLENPQLIGP